MINSPGVSDLADDLAVATERQGRQQGSKSKASKSSNGRCKQEFAKLLPSTQDAEQLLLWCNEGCQHQQVAAASACMKSIKSLHYPISSRSISTSAWSTRVTLEFSTFQITSACRTPS